MSDKMTPIPFPDLMKWILEEKHSKGTVFGVVRPYISDKDRVWKIFGGKLEMPFGPAAGPHTQLAQNLVASYYAGSRFFELKTVQIIDGEELPVSKPCIGGSDECYNVEWSTELYIPQALNEYVKAWIAIHVISKEFDLGAMDGFQFNMSVGYDLEGIKSEKIDRFMEGMKDASQIEIYKACMEWLLVNIGLFERFTAKDIKDISPRVCNCVTLSTLHGCPPLEIERIARYLLEEKKLHTFIKCNPTLLGYEYTRRTLDEMGYSYISFDEKHFKNDLQYIDAIPLFKRLQDAAKAQNLEFGVKITNTFPVNITEDELPGKEMYMSGKALYPLSMAVAVKLSADFRGDLRMSYSGGADYFNIDKIVAAGIWPVTMATTVLKPGGYQRFEQIAEEFRKKTPHEFKAVDAQAAAAVAAGIKSDKHYLKDLKPQPSRKIEKKVPLTDCFLAPCQEGCPIGQDITAYLKLVEEGKMKEALQVILEKNPLPFITGTICPHNCMSKCTRNFYDTPVTIRSAKLAAANAGYDALLPELIKPKIASGKKAAVVGGGPGGMAAAYFLAKGGISATIFEKRKKLGGAVRSAIPGFRIPEEAINRDVNIITSLGVQVVTSCEIMSVETLMKDFDYIVLAVGASLPGVLSLEEGKTINALDFLEAFNEQKGLVDVGKKVVVIGGGNTAMDTARAAKRTKGVENVTIVYRRTNRYMPAAEEELLLALEEGVAFKELLSPVSFQNGTLICRNMLLGEPDASGRRGVIETEGISLVEADTVISAVGEQVPHTFYRENGLLLSPRGHLTVNYDSLETSVKNVYAIGDGLYGPASVVEAIRDARKAAEGILKMPAAADYDDMADPVKVYKRKGVLADDSPVFSGNSRCLSCSSICEQCVEVCPNRANVSIQVPGMRKNQIIHIDRLCNECGNCMTFCPYDSAPYLEKLTLFANKEDMQNSKNKGFFVLDAEKGVCKVRLEEDTVFDFISGEDSRYMPENIGKILTTVMKEYSFLL